MDKDKKLWIVKKLKSYWVYDDHEKAIEDALKYKATIYKIELNKFKFHYYWDPFLPRDLTLKKI